MAAVVFPAPKEKDTGPNRTLQGVVTDASDNAVNGAVVQLKDTKTLQILSYITKNDGAYHFNGLNPNVDYEVKAEVQGGASSGTKRLSSFDTRKITVINLKLNK